MGRCEVGLHLDGLAQQFASRVGIAFLVIYDAEEMESVGVARMIE